MNETVLEPKRTKKETLLVFHKTVHAHARGRLLGRVEERLVGGDKMVLDFPSLCVETIANVVVWFAVFGGLHQGRKKPNSGEIGGLCGAS